jgi:hypothetical protein
MPLGVFLLFNTGVGFFALAGTRPPLDQPHTRAGWSAALGIGRSPRRLAMLFRPAYPGDPLPAEVRPRCSLWNARGRMARSPH